MARVLPVVTALAASASVAGCAQLAGIDETNNSNKANTVALTRVSIGTTVTTAPLDLTGLTATYLVPGAGGGFTAVPAVASSKPGVWSARMPSAEPVEFTLPDHPAPVPRLFELPASAIAVADVALEHPHPTPAPDGAMMTVTVPLDAPPGMADSFQTFSVGAWGRRQFAMTEVPTTGMTLGPVTYAYAETTNLGSSASLDKLTTQDALFVLRYTVVGLTGVAEATPFDQTGTDNITLPAMKPVMTNQPFNATLDTASYMTRFAAPVPAFSTLAMSWSLSAAPGVATATPGVPLVANFAVPLTDTAITTMYGNPFAERGWLTLFAFNTNEQRVYMSGAATLTLSAQMSQALTPALASTPLDLPAGLPTQISINGSTLTADDQTIAAPTSPVSVRFQTDNNNCTVFDLGVFEVVPAATMGQLTRTPVVAVTSDHPQFLVPPELFKAGSSYTVTAVCTFGLYPSVASGDFTRTQLPVARASLDSPVFKVAP